MYDARTGRSGRVPLWSTPKASRTRPWPHCRKQSGGKQLPRRLAQPSPLSPLVFKVGVAMSSPAGEEETLGCGPYDCLILAGAGLGRLGLTAAHHERDRPLHFHCMHVGQGSPGIVSGPPWRCRVISQLQRWSTTPLPPAADLAERAFCASWKGLFRCTIWRFNTSFEGRSSSAHRHGGQHLDGQRTDP